MEKSANNLSAKQVNKGATAIVRLTGNLNQVLKQFMGIYATKLAGCDGLTVEAWMEAMGVKRFTSTDKNGKEVKKGYTPGTIRAGWHKDMLAEDGKMRVFRNVAAKYKAADGTIYDVYTREEAKKIDGKKVTCYMQVAVEDHKWSVNTIIRGLKQGHEYKKHEEKSVDSLLDFDEMKELCIIRKAGETREVVAINKDEVTF